VRYLQSGNVFGLCKLGRWGWHGLQRMLFGYEGGKMKKASTPQPPPKPGRETVFLYVMGDIHDRVMSGKEKYGTYLQTHNGRDPLWDAYQEAIDLVMYLRQAILERGIE